MIIEYKFVKCCSSLKLRRRNENIKLLNIGGNKQHWGALWELDKRQNTRYENFIFELKKKIFLIFFAENEKVDKSE